MSASLRIFQHTQLSVESIDRVPLVTTHLANPMLKRTSSQAKIRRPSEVAFDFRLYVIGQSAKSSAAISNFQKICDVHLKNRYHIELIDLAKNPALAMDHQIVAIPTCIRQLPIPVRRIVGDLSKTEQVLVALEIVDLNAQK